jgi:ribosomal protein L7/L12
LVEKAPCVLKAGVKKEEAEQIKKLITEAGGQVEVS